ncbi:AmmeMemoRadiSam system protein B [Isoptericola sp. b441]|uniref:MEMO1 family protein Q6348_11715 n=1 Tax=Actinotalea lenta TaxID=3064654 RepID=A0ABT9DEX4_9CELL|nr:MULTISPECIES: AmmeMemoRadiSam system protein B [unclassified Isoptericola]MDO8107862.1 AmmeMemoRadiSam system protein B [Isoptericola sp. b441]MDO8120468.1 AmmeMemoRadiSam system protein B [Isoptericola sp. b490]
MTQVRPAAVAGLFYPAEPSALRRELGAMLAAAERVRDASRSTAKAYVLPHAGYQYSGSTAALGYAEIAAAHGVVNRVVLLGPTHRVAVDGLALPAAAAFATPLGQVRVRALDPELLAQVPQLRVNAGTHAAEHSLEVHLPFLQTVLGDVEVLPLAVGRASPQEVAEVLDLVWGGAETLVVVSSDLSHYLDYERAAAVDAVTLDQILALDWRVDPARACGAAPLNGLLLAAARHGLRARLLGACSSGDTAGDRRRVVGYAAVAFDAARDA